MELIVNTLKSAICLPLALWLWSPLPVHATDLPAIADTYTDSATPTSNFGGYGVTAVSRGRTTLIRFDSAALARTPGGTATLNLRIYNVKNWADRVSVRLVRGPWNERTVTAATLPLISRYSLDEKTINYSDKGKTLSFELGGALSAWRSDPSQNFGIAIVSSSPIPNVEFGAREMKLGATMSIQGPAENRLWVATAAGVALMSSDGTTLLTVPPLPGKLIQRYTQLVADPTNGGVWVTENDLPSGDYFDRVVRIGPNGTVEAIADVRMVGYLAVEPADGSIWVGQHYCPYTDCFELDDMDESITKYDRNGQLVARAVLSDYMNSEFVRDEASGMLWAIQGPHIPMLVQLFGTDAELNGYSIYNYTGPHHRVLDIGDPKWVSVNPNDDGQGRGNAWASDGYQLIKLAPSGKELLRSPEPTPYYDVNQMHVNPITGSVVARTVDYVLGANGTILSTTLSWRRYNPAGAPVAALPNYDQWDPARYFGEALSDFTYDPYRELIWSPNKELIGGKFVHFLAALDASSRLVARINTPTEPFAVAPQHIRVGIIAGNNGVVDSKNTTVTVSLLSRVGFDASQADPSSMRLGPRRALIRSFRVADINHDGRVDLLLDFTLASTGIVCGNLNVGMTGRTYQSMPLEGMASIQLSGCPQ
jgi:hypothetical protein